MTASSPRPAWTGEAAAIRPAVAGDWDGIAALLGAVSLPLDGARDHLERFVVAELEGAIVGCAGVERYGHTALLRSVAVRASERNARLGIALVERCITDARTTGVLTLVLLTTTAAGFFRRFGFATVDRASVPSPLKVSAEFRGACPTSATAMRLDFGREVHGVTEAASVAEVVIRTARPHDADVIAEIYNEGIRDRIATFETRERTATDVAAWFDTPHPILLVADRRGDVVGWVRASTYRARESYAGITEYSVYVRASERGRRVGDALMREFLPRCERAGFWKVLARIFPENLASRALCRRHGFREVGIYARHAKLDGAWRDVLIVERLLGEAAQ